ncbi:LamB/YcsF family protein [Halalkalicoccus jeotgali]|uniref:LamB/YcsF family protein n=1 Tax=Halalkalicoccus jeotgali (strain DSM 18796 / CECT 7217 / JCM 14584 / KCTC 4019 / B3) TaxID=795797 RepID=D8J6F9_HALJB|nr:5-oxoprolinase subunit PxpA [Halalkalicoccus jeotgali]ADJ13836.1 LamB/YcsF family protein [Halalkalicoccus jeotgali B3]ELY34118.1 LamB/YcsF family protein [Halalkalicoccus jeotgali B3]
MVRVDINCDMGESFGNWEMGRDEAVMPYITSANVAGGYHAGDPHVMDRTVALACEHDVGIGIHPGLPDKMGFGRRTMDVTPEEMTEYVVYQLGALDAFARANGTHIQHVKPHGAMYSMLSESPEHARAVMEGIIEVNPEIVYLATDTNIYEVAREFDSLRAVFEGYVDLTYRADRSLIVERKKESLDPELVADRFVSIALDGEVEAADGEIIGVPAESICIHGDTPNSVEILEAIHERIAAHDIELAPLSEIA